MNYFSGQELLTSSGQTVLANHALGGKSVLALYFSAHWCPPCRQFTPVLREAFRNSGTQKTGVVFVSSDRSPQDQLDYMRSDHGPWPAVRQGSSLAQALNSAFSIRGIPALIVINASDGSIIAKDGRSDVMSKGSAAFSFWESLSADSIDTSVVEMLRENEESLKKDACDILVRLLNNVLRDPGNMKFRSIRLSNPKIESKLLPANGAFEVLFSVGFEEGDDSLILPLSANMTTVTKFKEAIETVMGGARAVGGASSSRGAASSSRGAASSSRGAASSSGGAAPAVTRDMPRQPQLQPIDVPAGASTDFFNNMKSQNDFMMTLERELQHVQSYEDPNAQAEAKKLVPIERLESQAKEKFETIAKSDPNVKPALERDLLLLELLNWFKSDFFSWVNQPDCDRCGGKTQSKGYVPPLPQETADGAGRVEGYYCASCSNLVRFPRYHSRPAKLLFTRRGRCGEWANCFALILRSLGFETRHVLDWTDHVWVEVFSEAEGRWLHADPCENTCDKPLAYEVGWGKKLTYVIAASKDEIQDVTWRYSIDHDALKARRNIVKEQWLTAVLLKLSQKFQEHRSDEDKKKLTKRRLKELVELMSPKDKTKAKAEELEGRQSGSSAWRMARGEMGIGVEKMAGNVWRLTEAEKEAKVFHLEYDVVRDEYTRVSNNSEVTKEWKKGVSECEDIQRKVELDWGQVYLARKESAAKSSVKWELDLSDTNLSVKTVDLDVNSKTYENGRVIWQLCGGNSCLLPSSGTTLKSEGLAGSKHISLTAMLSGGKGDIAWQHTQLFRTHKDEDGEKAKKLRLVVKLKED